MHDASFEAELQRRLDLIEDPDSPETCLPDLPWRDVWLAVLALVVLSVALTWWGYPG